MAGVLLQKLIIEATQAKRDQDHIPVITYTNPQIPDRTASLFGPLRGKDFARAIKETAQVLETAGATVIGIPCNTSHARFAEIQAGVGVPVLNMIEKTTDVIRAKYGRTKVGLLATSGTVAAQVYQRENLDLDWIVPSTINQELVMKTIYAIKAGEPRTGKNLTPAIRQMQEEGAEVIVLACTELSLLYPLFIADFPDVPFVDSSHVLARSLVAHVIKQRVT